MNASRLRCTLFSGSVCSLIVFVVAGDTLPARDAVTLNRVEQTRTNSLTGIWKGSFVNDRDVLSNAYLNITENADGTLTGKWGNSAPGVLVIENGERVNDELVQWEAASVQHKDGRYRVRATLKKGELNLDVTYTWRENSKVKGLTAVSTLTRK